ncbi:flagellar filament capping protein FliD [Oribacterium sp. WCC10]|uniref:flagellar filament capping protein FliD n=1 Tax=Oribacterium sp. WCC10 TaxID=1855343 RepID=UPI0008E45F71|nr:flagellar filament capping protein FliD [Oribacterium sp. WCC10]SFG24651.1 flagellar hook-associated protein 2 [Oribacterium sp. WCC10]
MKVSDSSSSTSALGNTSLKGFGGLASGLDRDALIEQLTSTTNSKITKTNQNITRQEWRQEAYNSITDKMIDMEDDYLSYSGKTSIVNNSLYAKSDVTAKGNSSSTSLISATGNSNLLDYISVKGVSQLASSAYFTSTKMTDSSTGETATKSSKLSDLGFSDRNITDMTINGKSFEVTGESTISNLVSAINNSDAGVKATYVESTGKFMFFDKETGEESEVKLNGAAKALFGEDESQFTAGKDAVMYVSYGGSEPVAITSHNNTFNVDGLKVTASGTFGDISVADGTVSYDAGASVTFTASANVDKATERVKEFIEAYNKLVEEVNTHVTTRPSSGYDPLTEEQEDEMTEKEIEKWNKKAKEGILYNDSEIRNFSYELHGMMNDIIRGGISYSDLESIGITMSSDHADGGQLSFDEDKFRKAMETDSTKVEEIMCGTEEKTGFGATINKQLTPYATRYASRNGNSYGRLVEVAGSTKLSATKNNNEIYKKTKDYKEELEKWKSKLKTEQDRYIKQFSNLETLINSMNSQSSYLSSLSY